MFDLKANGTSVKTEVVAGTTTFFTMAYITVVNPLILSQAGVPFDQSFTATIIAAVIGTLLMGLVARYPIAVAPGMGLNAYFTYSVVQGHEGLGYIEAFSAVFVAGILFLVLSMTSLRRRLIEMIPANLKHAITVGIGLFIAFLGLRMSGIITAHPDNLVALGDLHQPSAVLALVGLAVTLVLLSRDVKGALFIGMIITGIIAYFADMLSFTNGIMSVPKLPEGILVWNPITAASDVIGHSLYAVVFSFLLVTLFDTTGTVVGVAQQAGLMKDNKLPRAERAMLSDSVATVAGAMVGTSPTTAYVESAAGVGAGGRTGLTSVVVAGLFVVAAFFSPLIGAVAGLSAITAPSLIVVGCLMLSNVRHIQWNDFDEAFPAFLVILTMPLTSSIATGIALGFISYPLMKIVKGNWKAVHPLMYIFAVLFVLQLVFVPH